MIQDQQWLHLENNALPPALVCDDKQGLEKYSSINKQGQELLVVCVRTATKPIATMKVANTNANKLVPTKTANRMKESKNKLVAADAAATKAVKQMEAGWDG